MRGTSSSMESSAPSRKGKEPAKPPPVERTLFPKGFVETPPPAPKRPPPRPPRPDKYGAGPAPREAPPIPSRLPTDRRPPNPPRGARAKKPVDVRPTGAYTRGLATGERAGKRTASARDDYEADVARGAKKTARREKYVPQSKRKKGQSAADTAEASENISEVSGMTGLWGEFDE